MRQALLGLWLSIGLVCSASLTGCSHGTPGGPLSADQHLCRNSCNDRSYSPPEQEPTTPYRSYDKMVVTTYRNGQFHTEVVLRPWGQVPPVAVQGQSSVTIRVPPVPQQPGLDAPTQIARSAAPLPVILTPGPVQYLPDSVAGVSPAAKVDAGSKDGWVHFVSPTEQHHYRFYPDITAHPAYAHDREYHWLVGTLETGRLPDTWYLRYASVDEDDPHGGRVTLLALEPLKGFHAGELVRVEGQLINPNDREWGTGYRVQTIRAEPTHAPERGTHGASS